jgi:hypothetical protein
MEVRRPKKRKSFPKPVPANPRIDHDFVYTHSFPLENFPSIANSQCPMSIGEDMSSPRYVITARP